MVIKDIKMLERISREGLIKIILAMDKSLDSANEIIETQQKLIEALKKI